MTDKRPNPVTFRDKRIEPQLAARARAEESLGLVAARDLARYYALLARERRAAELSRAEALALIDALGGWFADPADAPFLWLEVADALPDGLAAKWGIDGPALVAKLQALPPGQAQALVDAAERWWLLPEENGDNEARLRAVGLIR